MSPTSVMPRIGCIINTRSGSAGAVSVKVLQELFARRGLSPIFVECDRGSTISGLLQGLITDGCNVVIAGGGDGTVNTVASALLELTDPEAGPIPLGIIPLGTFNHFARDLNIPFELDAAVKVIADQEIKAVDVGEVNGHLFLNNSSLGLYPAIVRLREVLQNAGYRKWFAFARAAFVILLKFPKLRLELSPDTGPPTVVKTPLLFIGNNRFETGLTDIGKRRSLDQGYLWIMSPEVTTRGKFLAAALALLRKARSFDQITFEAQHVAVHSRKRRLRVATDGEISLLEPPLRYRIRPKSLRVIVPSAGQDGRSDGWHHRHASFPYIQIRR